MDNHRKVIEKIWGYEYCPSDALATLQFYYTLNPDDEDDSSENFAERTYWEIICGGDFIRDDDGYVIVDESIEWKKEQIDDIFYYKHSSSFTRTMNRMKKLKEELMAATWHPRRMERILELGGYTALDNFAGV